MSSLTSNKTAICCDVKTPYCKANCRIGNVAYHGFDVKEIVLGYLLVGQVFFV